MDCKACKEIFDIQHKRYATFVIGAECNYFRTQQSQAGVTKITKSKRRIVG